MELTLNTKLISGKIEEIVSHAKKELYIVSPYIKLTEWEGLRNNLMKFCNGSKGRKLIFLIRENDENKPNKALEEIRKFEDCSQIYLIRDLHAKLYVNERTALLTSMNLYDYSSQYNHEIGVVFSKSKDTEHYDNIKTFITNLIHDADYIEQHITEKKGTEFNSSYRSSQDGWKQGTFTVLSTGYKWVKVLTEDGHQHKIAKDLSEMDDGTPFTARVKISWNFGLFKRECVYEYVQILEVDAVCIVCGTPTVFDMDYPVCSACYIKPRFNSKCDLLRCHVCGEPSPRISYEKPLCYSCYQENC